MSNVTSNSLLRTFVKQGHSLRLLQTQRAQTSTAAGFPSSRYFNSKVSHGGGGAQESKFSGIFPPITTPFNENESVDYAKLEENMKIWNTKDFAGYVVMGSNGEAVSLKDDEKLELLRNVRKMASNSKAVIAGLGMPTTTQTIEMCNIVEQEKIADAALVISPSFYKGQMTEAALLKFYEDVANRSKLPVILYSVPANTTIDLSAALISKLSSHPNIIGVKDSGGDIMKISDIIESTPKDFLVIAGSAGFMLPALLMGCVGAISALANVLGDQVCELYKLFQKNEIEKAVALQRSLIVPNYLVTRKHGVPGLKAALDMTNLYGGPCRLPLLPLSSQERNSIKEAFAKSGHALNE